MLRKVRKRGILISTKAVEGLVLIAVEDILVVWLCLRKTRWWKKLLLGILIYSGLRRSLIVFVERNILSSHLRLFIWRIIIVWHIGYGMTMKVILLLVRVALGGLAEIRIGIIHLLLWIVLIFRRLISGTRFQVGIFKKLIIFVFTIN